jgi:ABC-type multidrug transport system ATPase subunit
VTGDVGQTALRQQAAAVASVERVAAARAPEPVRDAVPPAVALRGVSKRWRGKPHPLVDALDLDVAPGTAILLTGRNGAGKTTLLRLIAGVITPDRGSVTVQGLSRERSRREFNRRIAFLSAGGSGLYARLSVRRHLDLAARLALLGSGERTAAIERTMDEFDLRALADDRVDRLSTGQRQRVRIAMAFLHGPDLALLDEPSASLDDHGAGLLHASVTKLLARGGATMWCEPSGSRAGFAFDRHLVLEGGALHAA